MADSETGGDRIAGLALIASSTAIVLAMSHHPTDAHAVGLARIVHAAMILLIAAAAFGFGHFAIRRGLARPAILAGLVAYALACFGHVGAALINGFVVPALATAEQGAPGHDIFRFAWEANQALARLGFYGGSAAYLLWSADFLRRPGLEARLIGFAGLLAGAVPALLLATGWLAMDVAGALTIYATQAAWAALVGIHLLRGGLGR